MKAHLSVLWGLAATGAALWRVHVQRGLPFAAPRGPIPGPVEGQQHTQPWEDSRCAWATGPWPAPFQTEGAAMFYGDIVVVRCTA